MRFPRLQPGDRLTAELVNRMLEALEMLTGMTTDASSGIELVRSAGNMSLRLNLPPAGLVVSGFDDQNEPAVGDPTTEIFFQQYAFEVEVGSSEASVFVYTADPFHPLGVVTNSYQEFGGEKQFRDGLLVGTQPSDFISLINPGVPPVVSGGSGYAVGDVLALVGGSYYVPSLFSPASVRVTSVSGSAVTGIEVQKPSDVDFWTGVGVYSVVPPNPVATTPVTGTGSGCTINAIWQGVAPGAFAEFGPANISWGSLPNVDQPGFRMGNWQDPGYPLYATVGAYPGKFVLTCYGSSGGAIFQGGLIVGYLAEVTANVIADGGAATGRFGCKDAGGVVHVGALGTLVGPGARIWGGILTDPGCPQYPQLNRGADFKGQTGTQTIATLTVPASTAGAIAFWVSGYVMLTAVSGLTLFLQVSYTDETNTPRTVKLIPSGLTSGDLTTPGAYLYPVVEILAKSGTVLTLGTNGSGSGSFTYDVGGSVVQAR